MKDPPSVSAWVEHVVVERHETEKPIRKLDRVIFAQRILVVVGFLGGRETAIIIIAVRGEIRRKRPVSSVRFDRKPTKFRPSSNYNIVVQYLNNRCVSASMFGPESPVERVARDKSLVQWVSEKWIFNNRQLRTLHARSVTSTVGKYHIGQCNARSRSPNAKNHLENHTKHAVEQLRAIYAQAWI